MWANFAWLIIIFGMCFSGCDPGSLVSNVRPKHSSPRISNTK